MGDNHNPASEREIIKATLTEGGKINITIANANLPLLSYILRLLSLHIDNKIIAQNTPQIHIPQERLKDFLK